jgi:hypothetical protein
MMDVAAILSPNAVKHEHESVCAINLGSANQITQVDLTVTN